MTKSKVLLFKNSSADQWEKDMLSQQRQYSFFSHSEFEKVIVVLIGTIERQHNCVLLEYIFTTYTLSVPFDSESITFPNANLPRILVKSKSSRAPIFLLSKRLARSAIISNAALLAECFNVTFWSSISSFNTFLQRKKCSSTPGSKYYLLSFSTFPMVSIDNKRRIQLRSIVKKLWFDLWGVQP